MTASVHAAVPGRDGTHDPSGRSRARRGLRLRDLLSLAARLLGAGLVVACDIDADAATALPGGAIPFFTGSVDAVRGGAFDVVVANISETVIGDLKPEFERVAPRRVLSGFPQDASGEWTCVTEPDLTQ